MKAADIKAYQSKSYPALEKLAVKHFNSFIRWRDSQEVSEAFICISCRELKPVSKMHAGHFYSAGHHPILRFDEENVHGQCHRCNTHLHGNLNEYRINLERKIGSDRLSMLDTKAKAKGYRIDRWTLIEKIIHYKNTPKNDHINSDNQQSPHPAKGRLFQNK